MTPLSCGEVRDLIAAVIDGELPADERRAVEDHLTGCPECARAYEAQEGLRARLHGAGTYAVPPGLEARVRAALDAETRRAPVRPWQSYTRLAASYVLAAGLGAAVAAGALGRVDATDRAARDVVSAHVRALVTEQPVQVASSDSHTVRPWFAGKITFAPNVKDTTAQGYPLIGGRLDYIAEHRAAAMIYQRRQHKITVFALPEAQAMAAGAFEATRDGYNVVSWREGGFSYCAVSDLNRTELRQFAGLLGG